MKEFFGLNGNYEDMSPVVVPPGYTRDYIDGKVSWAQLFCTLNNRQQCHLLSRLPPSVIA